MCERRTNHNNLADANKPLEQRIASFEPAKFWMNKHLALPLESVAARRFEAQVCWGGWKWGGCVYDYEMPVGE